MSERKDDPNTQGSGVRIHYEIPAELHRRAKAEAALQGLTLKAFVIRLLVEATSDLPAGRG